MLLGLNVTKTMGSEQLTLAGSGGPCTVLLDFLVSDAIQEKLPFLSDNQEAGFEGAETRETPHRPPLGPSFSWLPLVRA